MKVLALTALGLSLAAAAPANAARPVKITVRAVSSCAVHRVYVRFEDGSVHAVSHVLPGPRLREVRSGTPDLYVVARIHASWARVTGGSGHRLRLTADGPAGEQWQWRFRLRSPRPLADPSDYVVCLHPMANSRPFVRRMKQAHGRWTFTSRLVSGRMSGSTGATAVASR